jgi:hypothetical protein
LEEAKRISSREELMTGCDCIRTLSNSENGNAVALLEPCHRKAAGL